MISQGGIQNDDVESPPDTLLNSRRLVPRPSLAAQDKFRATSIFKLRRQKARRVDSFNAVGPSGAIRATNQ